MFGDIPVVFRARVWILPNTGLDRASFIDEDHMTEVVQLFPGEAAATMLWISESAASIIEKEHDAERIMAKLRHFAQAGFWNYEGAENVPIRSEGNQVFRIRHKHSSLVRMIGFYPKGSEKREFVILDAFTKPGQKYKESQRERILTVASIRDTGQWRRSPL